MTVDGSYMAWARPTRRVHLALSVGMTVTGVILIAAGNSGGRSAARTAPVLGRTADSVVSGSSGAAGGAGGTVPAAPLVRFAPRVPMPVPVPVPVPAGVPGVGAKTHSKPRSHGRHVVSVLPPTTAPLPAHPPKH